jgi:hypothetical protein
MSRLTKLIIAIIAGLLLGIVCTMGILSITPMMRRPMPYPGTLNHTLRLIADGVALSPKLFGIMVASSKSNSKDDWIIFALLILPWMSCLSSFVTSGLALRRSSNLYLYLTSGLISVFFVGVSFLAFVLSQME